MFSSLRRETLSEQIVAHILHLIADKQLVAYDLLPSELKLAQEFGVSRPVIREALRSLEARRIITIVNGKGAVVQPLSGAALRDFFNQAVHMRREAVLELLEVRRGLELESASLAAQRHTPAELARMQQIVVDMRPHLHAPATYAALDLELHLCIAAASRNAMIVFLVQSLRDAIADTILEGLHQRTTPQQFATIQATHEEIVAAIAAGSATAAAAAMARHLDDALVSLKPAAHEAMADATASPAAVKGDMG